MQVVVKKVTVSSHGLEKAMELAKFSESQKRSCA